MALNNSKKEIESMFEDFRPQLEEKAEDSYALMEKIIQKTKPDLALTRKICTSICNSENYIEEGQELSTVERLIKKANMNNNTQEPILYPNRIWLITTVIAVFASIFGTISFLNLINSNKFKTLADVPVPTGKFYYGGSTTFAPLRNKQNPQSLVAAIKKVHPEFELIYRHPIGENPGSVTGIQMLLDKDLAFSMSSQSVNDKEFKSAQLRGLQLDQNAVAIDGIAIFVHGDLPTLPKRGLTISQIEKIFTGEFTSWKDVGGPNLKITCWIRDPKNSGTSDFFQEKVLQGKKYKSEVKVCKNETDCIEKVRTNKGSISFASAPEIVNHQKIQPLPIAEKMIEPFVSSFSDNDITKPNIEAFINGTYPITRKLYIVIRKDGSVDEKAGDAYTNLLLSDEGQKFIEKAGFGRIR